MAVFLPVFRLSLLHIRCSGAAAGALPGCMMRFAETDRAGTIRVGVLAMRPGMSLFSSSGQPTPPGPTPPYSDEAVQRLRRNRAVATGLLAGMGLIYAATHLV